MVNNKIYTVQEDLINSIISYTIVVIRETEETLTYLKLGEEYTVSKEYFDRMQKEEVK